MLIYLWAYAVRKSYECEMHFCIWDAIICKIAVLHFIFEDREVIKEKLQLLLIAFFIMPNIFWKFLFFCKFYSVKLTTESPIFTCELFYIFNSYIMIHFTFDDGLSRPPLSQHVHTIFVPKEERTLLRMQFIHVEY